MNKKTSDEPTIGERINSARDLYDWNQTELSEMIEVTRAAISQYEMDMIKPRPEIVERLARVFNADPEWFVFGRGRGPRQVETPVIIPAIDVSMITSQVTDLRHLRLGCDVGLRKSWFKGRPSKKQLVTFVAPNDAGPVLAGDNVVVDLGRRDGDGVFLGRDRAGDARLYVEPPKDLDVLGRVISYHRAI
jgi:transcriptional regulator with XRE-family HTH domain